MIIATSATSQIWKAKKKKKEKEKEKKHPFYT
jgi:hypothetical protein